MRSWQRGWHHWRLSRALLDGAGGLWALVAALAVAVSCVASVAWLNDRLTSTLVTEAGAWLAGDLQIASSRPFAARWHAWRAQHPEIRVAESVTTTSMVRTPQGDRQLVALRAIGPGYPLRGTIRLRAAGSTDEAATEENPRLVIVDAANLTSNQAWIDARLSALLGLREGMTFALGRSEVVVAGILESTPEQGADFLSFLPEVIVSTETLDASGLIAPGSRATWRWHIVAPQAALPQIKAEIEALLQPGERLVAVDEAQPSVKTLLEQVQRFLRLGTIAAVVLAAVAVALAARRVALQLTRRVAVVRALGISRLRLLMLLGLRFLVLAALGVGAGLVIGWGAQSLFAELLQALVAHTELAPAAFVAGWPAALLGFVLVAAFVTPWLVWLVRLPPIAVLRHVAPPSHPLGWLGWVLATSGALAGVTVALAGEWQLAVTALAVIAAITCGFGVLAIVLLRFAYRFLPQRTPTPVRLILLFLVRQPLTVAIQVAALAVGLTAIWLLLFVRSDLLAAWRYQTPPDAPNRFVINVMPDQVAPLTAQFEKAGIAPPRFWPMVRGRLQSINGAPIPQALLDANPRAERLANREFNLIWSTALPEDNRIVAGRWHGDSTAREASVEAGLAKLFDIKVGDTVTFGIAGETVTVSITSIRALRWESMRPNFFFITTPAALEHFPAIFMAAIRLPPHERAFERTLVAQFPNVTVIDVEQLRAEFERLSNDVTRLLEAVFAFALAAGGLVLLLGWAAGDERRAQQVALLRALGLQERVAHPFLLGEAATVGALAALFSVLAASLLGSWLAYRLFDLLLPVRWGPLAAAALIVAVLVGILGWWRAKGLLAQPPLTVLRAASPQ